MIDVQSIIEKGRAIIAERERITKANEAFMLDIKGKVTDDIAELLRPMGMLGLCVNQIGDLEFRIQDRNKQSQIWIRYEVGSALVENTDMREHNDYSIMEVNGATRAFATILELLNYKPVREKLEKMYWMYGAAVSLKDDPCPTTESKRSYFLFGSRAARIFQNEGVEQFIHQSSDPQYTWSYDTFIFTEGETLPDQLLQAYNGNRDYLNISEEDYNRIK